MKKHLLTILLALSAPALLAAPYQPVNVRSLVSEQGASHTVNMPALQRAMDNLAQHAGDYPVRFDNDADRRRAIADLKPLGYLLDSMVQNSTPRAGAAATPEYLSSLHMRARLNWMAHNLDQAGAAAKADADYAKLLALAPARSKPAVQDEFGNFLASSSRMDRAVPMLRAAYRGGRKESGLGLSMALLAQGKRSEALPLLREYVRNFPQNQRAKELLEAVEAGRVETRRAPLAH